MLCVRWTRFLCRSSWLHGYHGSQSTNRMTSHAISGRYRQNDHTRRTCGTWLAQDAWRGAPHFRRR